MFSALWEKFCFLTKFLCGIKFFFQKNQKFPVHQNPTNILSPLLKPTSPFSICFPIIMLILRGIENFQILHYENKNIQSYAFLADKVTLTNRERLKAATLIKLEGHGEYQCKFLVWFNFVEWNYVVKKTTLSWAYFLMFLYRDLVTQQWLKLQKLHNCFTHNFNYFTKKLCIEKIHLVQKFQHSKGNMQNRSCA